MSDRLAELQKRQIRNMVVLGVGMLVACPVGILIAPFGIIVGPLVGVLGIATIVRAIQLRKPAT